MKHILAILLCIGWAQQTQAQSINLFDVDATNFPTMKGKFYAFDAAGNQQRPSTSELTLTENGIPRTITNVSCPQVVQEALSSVLVVDVSGSMSGGSGSSSNIDLAKTAAHAWVNGLQLGKSECAITSFDDANYLNQDFTTDKTKLLSAINTLQPNGSTDYNVALIKPMSGGLIVSKDGKYQKVLVFLTDGLPNFEPDVNKIVSEAIKQRCIIFCVTLGMPAPQSVKDIATRTGGEYYENIISVQQAIDVYSRILQAAQKISPCEVTWSSDIPCSASKTLVELTWNVNKSTSNYQPPLSIMSSLKVTPSYVSFDKCMPTTQNDTTITLTAQNADYIVMGIHHNFSTSDFTFINISFPFTIPKNTSKDIILRFIPSDSGMQYVSFEITTNRCPEYLTVRGGFPGKKTKVSTLMLTQPNTSEEYVVGSDTVIKWSGVMPMDTVTIEYTIDNGATWHLLTNKATGLNYSWKNIPLPVSTKCLVRIAQKKNSTQNTTLTLVGHSGAIHGLSFSPYGDRIITGSADHLAKIWDTSSGENIQTLSDHTDEVTCVAFSPSESTIATGSLDKTIKIWDTKSGKLIRTLAQGVEVFALAYSPDGTKIISGGADGNANLWDINLGSIILTIPGTVIVGAVAFSPDGKKIALRNETHVVTVWDLNSKTLLYKLIGHRNEVRSIAFSPDGSKIATAAGDDQVYIWSVQDGSRIRMLKYDFSRLNCVVFSPYSDRVLTGTVNGLAIIWDLNTGNILRYFTHSGAGVSEVAYSSDSKVATSSWDGAKIWDINDSPLQEDVSDTVFSIVAPSPASQDVDMKQCLVSTSKDSLITTFIQNAGTYPFRVDSIAIVGTDASQFQLVSGIPPYTIGASGTHAVEFRFKPISVGVKTAQLLVYTQTDTLRQTIRGEGVAPTLQVLNDIIDFGKVEVGNQHDSLQTTTIKNIGNAPLPITATHHAGPNDKDFTTLAGGGGFTLQPGEVKTMDLRFAATDVGRTSGRLLFDYNGAGSPATVQLLAEGIFNASDTARTTVSVNNITAQAGEKVNLQLVLKKQSGMKLAGAPTDWYARVHYNSSVLYNTQTNNACIGTTDSCVIELNGTYNPTQSELISVPCVVTLGNTDNATITIDEFRWTNNSITTEVVTENGTIHVTGICDEGGVRLFMPSNVSTSLATRPNPAQNTLAIHYGLREPLNVTIELINTTGQVVQTFVQSQQQAKGEYTLNEDISTLGNGVYMLRLVTNKDVLTTRVDVVK